MILAHGVAQLEILGAVEVEEFRPNPDHEKLSNLFFERQLAESFLSPFLAFAVETNGSGVLIFFLRQDGHIDG